MTWSSIFSLLKALGQVVGLVRDTKQAVSEPYEPTPSEAAAQRAGTAAGAAAYSAGKRAGKEK
jgi:hypothetical protein